MRFEILPEEERSLFISAAGSFRFLTERSVIFFVLCFLRFSDFSNLLAGDVRKSSILFIFQVLEGGEL